MLVHFPLQVYFLFQSYSPSPLLSFLEIIMLILFFLFFAYLVGKVRRQSLEGQRWFQPYAHLHLSSQLFYETLEGVIADMKMPGVNTNRRTYQETGFISSSREYLRVSYRHQIYDICAAPFGHGFFLSYWQVDTSDFFRKLIRAIPKVGRILESALYGKTYYQIDTEDMFKSVIHQALLDVAEMLSKEKGIRGYQELERNPLEAERPN